MSFSEGAGKDSLQPADESQIGSIIDSVDNLLDGSLAVARKSRTVRTTIFDGILERASVVKFSNPDKIIVGVGIGEAQEFIRNPQVVYPEIRENNVYSMFFEARGLPGYDHHVSLQTSIPFKGDSVSYVPVQDPSLDWEKVEVQTGGGAQAYSLDLLLDVISGLMELDEQDDMEQAAAQLAPVAGTAIRAFMADYIAQRDADPQLLDTLRLRYLHMLEEEPARGEFTRQLGSSAGGIFVTTGFDIQARGETKKTYTVQSNTPVSVDGFNVFTTKIHIDAGGNYTYLQYLDFDDTVLFETSEEGQVSAAQRIAKLIKAREAAKDAFRAERTDGFHVFTSEDATQLLAKLDYLGSEEQ